MAKILGLLKRYKIATVQIMSLQGIEIFYKKLGYVEEDFEQTEYINGSNCIFMRKAL